MKQILLTFLALALISFTVDAQRTLIDMEAAGDAATFVTAFDAGSGGFSVIANPDASGINTSDSVGQFIEAPDGENWAGFYFDIDSAEAGIDLSNANKEVCLDVWMAAGDISLKLEELDASGGATANIFEPTPIAPSAYSTWSTVCFDYTGTMVDNITVRRVVFLFNLLSAPMADETHYFDNVRKPFTTNTEQLIKGKAIKVFPSPATFDLYFDTDGSPRTIIVSDLMGRQLDAYNGYTANSIRVADYAAGTYLITFIDEATGETTSTKFVKQ